MANQPCCIPCITCAPGSSGLNTIDPDPNDPNNPFLPNLSSEAPDPIIYVGVWYPPPQQPPLAGTWKTTSCIGVCTSTISQADADACAQRAQLLCLALNWPQPQPNPNVGAEPPPGFPPFPPTISGPTPLFLNEAQSCDFICPDGTPSTYTVPAGTYFAFNQATANQVAYLNACGLAVQRRLCVGSLSPSQACLNEFYTGEIPVAIGSGTFSVSLAAGALPPGLSLSQSVGGVVIEGYPTTLGIFDFTLRIEDSFGRFVLKDFALSTVAITSPTTLPEIQTGVPYSYTFTVSSEFVGPIAWSIVSGALPPGIELDEDTGTISGTTDTAAGYVFAIRANNGNAVCEKSFMVTADDAPVVCVALDGIVWGTPAYDDGGGLQTVTGSWEGPEFSYHIIAPATNLSASASNTGNVPISMGPILVTLALTWTAPPGNGGGAWQIQIGTGAFGDLLNITNGDMLINTSEEFTFAVPQTSADDFYIIVQGNIFSGVPQETTLSGSLSCEAAFGNTEQNVHIDCDPGCTGDGGNGSVPANTYYDTTQGLANAQALAVAQQAAEDELPFNCACPPDFSQMAWVATINTVNGGTASFTPNPGSSATFTALSSAAGATALGEVADANGTYDADVPMSGNANLHLNITCTTPLQGRALAVVTVFVDANPVGNVTTDLSGSFDIPFSVNGALQVTCTVLCNSDNSPSGPQGPVSCTVAGAFTIV